MQLQWILLRNTEILHVVYVFQLYIQPHNYFSRRGICKMRGDVVWQLLNHEILTAPSLIMPKLQVEGNTCLFCTFCFFSENPHPAINGKFSLFTHFQTCMTYNIYSEENMFLFMQWKSFLLFVSYNHEGLEWANGKHLKAVKRMSSVWPYILHHIVLQ